MTPEGAAARCGEVLQALLVASVVAWVLDLPRSVLGLAFYTEQFLTFVLGLALALAYVGDGKRPTPRRDWLAAALALAICAYIAVRYPDLSNELATRPLDGIIGSLLLIVLVLEATRRGAGTSLVVITLVMAVYIFIAPHLPGEFATRPVSVTRLLVYLGLDLNAMIGSILGVTILIIVPFTILSQVLARTGGSEFFADLAMSAMGSFRGGAAKIAVVGSALFGMISGTAVSNVMAVGIVTIPLMMRSGFSPQRSAAIEAVGSTGGQLMPPVMGAAAFIMAELLQVPYGAVVIAAILPSLLYYGTLFICVDLEAAKHRIGAVQIADAPGFLAVLRSGWHFLAPLAFLVAGLIWFEMQPERAALYATGLLIVFSLAFGYRGKRVAPAALLRAVIDSARASTDIVLIGAASGLIVGILSISGLAFGLTLQLITLSGENLVLLLLMTAVVSFVLGLGLPTVSVYVLTATLVAPALVELGVTPMAAHMFVMYNGMLSMITPPVALASFAAANIARTSAWETGWVSIAFGSSTFLLPFLFVGSPSLLMNGAPLEIAWDFARTGLGIWIGCAAVIGHGFAPLGPARRVAYGALALAVLLPAYVLPQAWAVEGAVATLGVALLVTEHLARRRRARTG